MTVLSTLLKADGMGLAERLSEWLLRRRERQEERNMRQVTAYFGSLLKKRRADAGAILQSVRDYWDCPEVTRKQAELLLEHRFFRYVYQTGYPEWRAVMDGGKCILQLRGVRPFFSDKFDITKHPRYQYLSDADKRNVFDVERYMKRKPAIVKPDEPFDMYELNASDLEPDNNNSTKRKEK